MQCDICIAKSDICAMAAGYLSIRCVTLHTYVLLLTACDICAVKLDICAVNSDICAVKSDICAVKSDICTAAVRHLSMQCGTLYGYALSLSAGYVVRYLRCDSQISAL